MKYIDQMWAFMLNWIELWNRFSYFYFIRAASECGHDHVWQWPWFLYVAFFYTEWRKYLKMTTFHDVLQAQIRIRPHVHRTPVYTSATVDKITGRKVFFKAENLQKTGAFKARGALNAVCIFFYFFILLTASY
jgi:hypothetical protein